MEEYALYKALQNFTPFPNDNDCLEFQRDDVFQISVQSPFTDDHAGRKGWLFAYNRRTGKEGYVPGNYRLAFTLHVTMFVSKLQADTAILQCLVICVSRLMLYTADCM